MYYFDNGKLWHVEKSGKNYKYCPIYWLEYTSSDLKAVDPREINPWGIDWLRSTEFRKKNSKKKPEVLPKVGDLVKIRQLEAIYEWVKSTPDSIYLKLIEGDAVLAALTEEEKEYHDLHEKGKYYQLAQGTDLVVYDPDYVEFDPTNLSTYPTEACGPDIQTIVLDVSGFTQPEDTRLITTPGGTISLELFMLSLKVSLKRDITKPLPDYGTWKKGASLDWHLMKSNEDKVIEKGGFIRLLVNLYNPFAKKGISPIPLNGMKAEDLFEVSWAIKDPVQSNEMHTKTIAPKYDDNLFTIKEGLPWRLGAKDAILRKE